MSLPKAKTQSKKKYSAPTKLNIKSMPTSVTGFPEAMYEEYCFEIIIRGPNQVTRVLRKLDSQGQPGKEVQLEDALRLCRAPGFVRGCEKEEIKSKTTEDTRMFFAQTKFDAKVVKDPKVFLKSALTYEENWNKSRQALERAGESQEDVSAKAFFSNILDSAKDTLDAFLDDRKAGRATPLKDIAKQHGLPASMISKTLTGFLDVPPNAKFWSALVGREPDKFCNISLTEIVEFSLKKLNLFYDDLGIFDLRALSADGIIRAQVGIPGTAPIPQKIMDKYMSQTFPILPIVGKLASMLRAEHTKTTIRIRGITGAIYPALTKQVNKILTNYYVCPPIAAGAVKEYWTGLAGQNLIDPEVSSTGYRKQVIDILAMTEEKTTPRIHGITLDEEFYYEGLALSARTYQLHAEHIRVAKIDEYQPIEIVGAPKQSTKKAKNRANAIRKSNLTKQSARYIKGLRENKIPEIVIAEVVEYLESFLYDPMQQIAAKIVYLTCRLKLADAQKTFGMEVDDDSDGDEADKSDTEDGKGEDEEEEPPLPPPIEEQQN